MNKKFFSKLKNKPWMKILGATSLTLMVGASFCGIGFGINHFVQKGTESKGISYTDSLQSMIQVQLNQNKTDQQNLQEVKNISNKFANKIKLLGATQIRVESGLQKTNDYLYNNNPVTYGSIYIYTEENLPNLNLDFSSDNPDSQNKNKLINQYRQKLGLYYALSTAYNYQLEAFKPPQKKTKTTDTKTDNKDNKKTDKLLPVEEVNNFLGTYNLNKNTKAYKLADNIEFNLLNDNKKNTTWNLSGFQSQFTNEFKWNGKGSREQAISKADVTKLETPDLQYLFWRNRTGLINRLEIDATIGALYHNMSSSSSSELGQTNNLTANQVLIATDMYQSLGPADQNFADWAGQASESVGYYPVMKDLVEANQVNYLNNDSKTDPLLQLLNQYFNSTTFKNFSPPQNNPNQPAPPPATTKDFSWLYSWNFNNPNLELVQGYLQPIDYFNFYNFFSDNSNLKKKDYDAIKKTYKSNQFQINFKSLVEQHSITNAGIVDIVDNINNSSIFAPIINEPLVALYEKGVNSNQSALLYNGLHWFFNNVITKYNLKLPYSVTKLNAFNGSLVGLGIIILLIGIIVSVIYRVPGVINFITNLLTFGLTLAMFASLNQMLFTVDSYLALFVSMIICFVPFIISQKQFKRAIENNKLNLYNSYVYALRSFIKNSIVIDIAMLIIALVFMFFGQYQIKAFGSMFILSVFATIISSAVIYLMLYSLSFWLMSKNYTSCFVWKKYVEILKNIETSSFNDQEQVNSYSDLIDKFLNKMVYAFQRKQWWIWLIFSVLLALGIIGCIVLGTVGAAHSFSLKSTAELVLTYQPNDTNNIVKLKEWISSHYTIRWTAVISLVNGNQQIIGYANYGFNLENFYNGLNNWIIQNSLPSNLLNNISFRSVSNFMPLYLLNNVIDCMLISLGFLAIWSMIVLNVVNFIPIFIVSCLANITAFGIIGIIRVPVSMLSISLASCLFVFSQLLIYTYYNFAKADINKKTRYTLKELFSSTYTSLKANFITYGFVMIAFSSLSLVMMIFNSTGFVYQQLVLFIDSIVIYGITVVLSPVFFALCMYIREVYLSKVIAHRKLHHSIKHKKYDKVDEQEIWGINLH